MQNSLIIDPSRPTFFPLPSDNKLDSAHISRPHFFEDVFSKKKKIASSCLDWQTYLCRLVVSGIASQVNYLIRDRNPVETNKNKRDYFSRGHGNVLRFTTHDLLPLASINQRTNHGDRSFLNMDKGPEHR